MTQQEINEKLIDETVAYYSEDVNRRAVDSDCNCHYLDDRGMMCAVGRCLIDPSKEHSNTPASDIVKLTFKLKPQYRGFTSKLWLELQLLHDLDVCWTKDGLSDMGKMRVNDMKNRYCT